MNMKRLLGILVVMAGLGLGYAHAAGERQTSSDFTDIASSGTVSVSQAAWTKVPTTSNVSRWGIMITNPATNNASFLYRTQTDGIAPAVLTVGHELAPGESVLLSFSGFMQLYLISLHSGAETVYFEEYK